MITIEIEEDLLPWIVDSLNSYEDGCIDEDVLVDRYELINDLIDLFEFYNEN